MRGWTTGALGRAGLAGSVRIQGSSHIRIWNPECTFYLIPKVNKGITSSNSSKRKKESQQLLLTKASIDIGTFHGELLREEGLGTVSISTAVLLVKPY